MFSLVRFENGGYDIYSSKCVRRIKDVQCTVKVKGGTKYLASLVDVSDTNKNFNAEEPPCSFFVNNLKITSTPICEAATDNVGLCVSEQFSDELLECTGMSAASSSVPSGATEILKVMGESFLLDNSTQSHVSMTCSEEIALEDSPSGDLLEQDVADNSKNKNSVENYEQISTNENMPTYCTDESEDKDDDIADPNYVPEESTNNANGSKDSSENISTREKSSILDDSQSVDIRTLTVTASKDCSKRTTKKHFCLYCHSLQTKFARHLTLKHKTEEDVKKFINIPKGFPERKKIIDAIRKKGDFLHNVKLEYNTGILIPSRQRQEKHKNSAEDYVCCKNCKGFFSKKTVRIHYSKCNDNHKKGREMLLLRVGE
ncbi:hypothetical protein FQR65_LT17835 [Abscondita terminalis]|nr:hypothetical protein FQR65_LT17835 [Abscondita terminalis]